MTPIDRRVEAEMVQRIVVEEEKLRVLKSNLIQADSDRSHLRQQKEESKVNAELYKMELYYTPRSSNS